MTASNSKAAAADKNLKTNNAETRRASKPLMEKRRRARINQSLAILKTLIVDSQKVEGQKHSKLEKADILEMTVSHLQSVKKSDEQKFMEGFEECFSESIRFLEKTKINTSTIDMLAEHLKHFQSNMDASVIFNPNHASSASNDGESFLSSSLDNRSVSAKLLKFTLGSDQEITNRVECDDTTPSASKFPLHVPQFFKSEFPKENGSPSSSCVSPSLSVTISNDSNNNNNNFIPDSLRSPATSTFPSNSNGPSENPRASYYHHHQRTSLSPLTSNDVSPCSSSASKVDDQYVLNLSTHRVSYASSPNYPSDMAISIPKEESMDFDNEPVDFSRPLNLSKHPLGYRLSEDGVWRPW